MFFISYVCQFVISFVLEGGIGAGFGVVGIEDIGQDVI